MNATVKDVMSHQVVTVSPDDPVEQAAWHVLGVVAVQDRLSYPDGYPVVAGPVF